MSADSTRRWLPIATLVCAVALIAQTVRVALIAAAGSGAPPPVAEAKPLVPAYDYRAWHPLPVQAGRAEPFETACEELVREITCRGRFEKQDPVALVLAWMITEGKGASGCVDWEHYPFILCEYADLRTQVYSNPPPGRYASPADLRASPGFARVLERVAKARAEHREKAHLFLSTTELKAEEVGRRLARYDTVCGRPVSRLFGAAIIADEFIQTRDLGASDAASEEKALDRLTQRQPRDPCPLHLVPLDRAAGSGWFSVAQVRLMRREPKRWDAVLQDRFAEAPQRYLAGEDLAALRDFQQQIVAGRGEAALGELQAPMVKRLEERIEHFTAAHKSGNLEEANRLFYQIARTPADLERVQHVRERVARQKGNAAAVQREVVAELRAILVDADQHTLDRMRQALAHAQASGYRPDDPVFRPLHLDYLEALFPDLYRRSAAAREFPEDDAEEVAVSFHRLSDAYNSGDASKFSGASSEFFDVLKRAADDAGQKYPGTDSLSLELAFNRMQPFRWAWVLMLVAAIAFALRLGLELRVAALTGYVLAFGSLALQVFGFYCRVRISGWAPVSNMYETIIFASLMTFVFSLVLEFIYRRTIFVLTGSLVSMLGLILADNLPLESSIGGLVPVLRTNFWLTVHVITIICGYAAGALAWGVGNLTLGLLAFGRGGPATLKLLSNFTYRALQLTVVLLATGTFLGGWWAAEAWGRFWGWDPKEVGALVALVCYVIPLHARYIGWVRDFGLAVAAVLCFGSIIVSWYVINFVLAAGLHSYGFGGGGGPWVAWAVLLNLQWLLICSTRFQRRLAPASGVA
jgi:ABC-type transport system involved in cytochrome c biogenesis permease subunit